MNGDEKLNKMLAERSIPEPSSNLAYRISQLAEERHSGGARWFDHLSLTEQILRMFVVPKPIYVTAFCLLLGLAVGFYNGESDVTTQDWLLFLDMEEGDWI